MTIAQRIGQVAREQELTQRCAKFFDVARYVALEKDEILDPAGQTAASKHIQQILKSVVAAGSTTGWGQPLAPYAQLVDAFLLSLRSASAFDAMLPWMKGVPLHQQIVVASGGATATTVPEGAATPIAKLQFSASSITENKTVCIVAITSELLRDGNSNLFAQEMTRAVASATDTAFISRITVGISPTPSNGGTSVAILQDLATLLAGLALDASSKVFLIVSSDIAKHWAVATSATGELAFAQMTPMGGAIQGMDVLLSDGVSGQIIAVDASQIAAAGGTVELDSSGAATVQMDGAPDSPPSAATNLISFWQMNLAGLRATRYWGAERLRTGAVSVISNVAYGGNSPA